MMGGLNAFAPAGRINPSQMPAALAAKDMASTKTLNSSALHDRDREFRDKSYCQESFF